MTTLAEARIAQNLSMRALGGITGICFTTICRMEHGHGCLEETFLAICEALGLDPEKVEGVNIRRKIGKHKWSGTKYVHPNRRTKEATCEPESLESS
jgi:hypothetical protein